MSHPLQNAQVTQVTKVYDGPLHPPFAHLHRVILVLSFDNGAEVGLDIDYDLDLKQLVNTFTTLLR